MKGLCVLLWGVSSTPARLSELLLADLDDSIETEPTEHCWIRGAGG